MELMGIPPPLLDRGFIFYLSSDIFKTQYKQVCFYKFASTKPGHSVASVNEVGPPASAEYKHQPLGSSFKILPALSSSTISTASLSGKSS